MAEENVAKEIDLNALARFVMGKEPEPEDIPNEEDLKVLLAALRAQEEAVAAGEAGSIRPKVKSRLLASIGLPQTVSDVCANCSKAGLWVDSTPPPRYCGECYSLFNPTMLEVGVEGDRFNPHPQNKDCETAGCVKEEERFTGFTSSTTTASDSSPETDETSPSTDEGRIE